MKLYKKNNENSTEGTTTEVTKFFKTGRTELFSIDLKDYAERAEEFASEKGTYTYSVYAYSGTPQRLKFVGLGVPK